MYEDLGASCDSKKGNSSYAAIMIRKGHIHFYDVFDWECYFQQITGLLRLLTS